jgi:hypothetical protein
MTDKLGQGGKYRHHKYTWVKPFDSAHHRWEVIGPIGAIHFHVSLYQGQPSAGLEFHHISGEGAPHHINCPLTGGRCWHDGTSLYANETVWPIVEPMLRCGDHEAVFRFLEREADRHFDHNSTA